MKNLFWTICCVLILFGLNSCTADKVEIQDRPDYTDYSPGYTGYTIGYDGYGTYDDGYGPSFWNPRNYFYTGSDHAYRNTYNSGR